MCPFKQSDEPTIGNSLFGAAKLLKNVHIDIYKYSGYGIEFVRIGSFSFSNGSGFVKNVAIFGANMISSVHVDNKKKDILIFGKVHQID